jgi:LemA protein
MENIWIIVAIAVLAIAVLFIIVLYNSLVRLNLRVKEAWSDIGVQLKRRADLLGNLVDTVKASAKFEQTTIENVTKARTGLTSALDGNATPAQVAKAENALTRVVGGLNFEAYPQLRATENYGKLMDEISDTEDKIQASRRFYNNGVMTLNAKIKVFPNNIFAKTMGFTEQEMFEPEEREALAKGHDASKSTVNFEE